jgi:hypothetical protein
MQDNAHVRLLVRCLAYTPANFTKTSTLSHDPLKKITAIPPLITSSLIHRIFATNRSICSAYA